MDSFISYRELTEKRVVRYGGNNEGEIAGIGDILVISKSKGKDVKYIFKDVLYIPHIGRKLISLGVLTKHGLKGKFEASQMEFHKNDDCIVKATRQGTLWEADFVDVKIQANVAVNESNLDVWHKRLCHLNHDRIIKMAGDECTIGLDDIDTVQKHDSSIAHKINSRSCMMGKLSKKSVPRSLRTRALEVGERVHVNVCGPIEESWNKNKYFVLFKDEYSCFRFIYFIKTKDQVYDCLKNVFAQVKANAKADIRRIMSDQGPEIINKKSLDYLAENKAVSITSAAFTASQNGLIERDNRTVMDAVRSMLFDRKLPSLLWAEAANTAVYVLNRTSNTVTGSKTPFELYTNVIPRLSQLRIFGCLAFLKPSDKKRSGYQRK